LFNYPPCNPDLTPGDDHLLTYLKNWLWSQGIIINEKLMEGAKTWLSSQAADFFDTGIKNSWVPAVTMLRISWSMYIFFVYNFFSHYLFW
jgi:hypothetical protein